MKANSVPRQHFKAAVKEIRLPCSIEIFNLFPLEG